MSTNLTEFLPDSRGLENWDQNLRNLAQEAQDQLNAKAAAAHTHEGGAGGDTTIIARGNTAGRPASGSEMLYVNTEEHQLEHLDGTGSVLGEMNPLVAPIPLRLWRTHPAEYTVTEGSGLLGGYVFPAARGVLYCTISVPFSGYDLRLKARGKMLSAETGKTVRMLLAYRNVSAGESLGSYGDFEAWWGARDGYTVAGVDTPNSANTLFDLPVLTIQPSAYSKGSSLLLALERYPDGTHTGDLEVLDDIYLGPVI